MKNQRHGHVDRKALQLCGQVRWAIESSINEFLHIDSSVTVAEVVPAPNTSHLAVFIEPTEVLEMHDLAELEGQLRSIHGRVRTVVAEAICRKKTPNLSFFVRPHSLLPPS